MNKFRLAVTVATKTRSTFPFCLSHTDYLESIGVRTIISESRKNKREKRKKKIESFTTCNKKKTKKLRGEFAAVYKKKRIQSECSEGKNQYIR